MAPGAWCGCSAPSSGGGSSLSLARVSLGEQHPTCASRVPGQRCACEVVCKCLSCAAGCVHGGSWAGELTPSRQVCVHKPLSVLRTGRFGTAAVPCSQEPAEHRELSKKSSTSCSRQRSVLVCSAVQGSLAFCFLNVSCLCSLLDDISGTLPTSVLVGPMGSSLQSFPLPPPPPPHAPGQLSFSSSKALVLRGFGLCSSSWLTLRLHCKTLTAAVLPPLPT